MVNPAGESGSLQPRIQPSDWIKAALFPAALAALFLTAYYTGLLDRFADRETILASFEQWAGKAALMFTVAYALLPLVFVPRALLALVGGFLFGWNSILYTWIGALIGESMAYALAHYLGRPILRKVIKGRGRKVIRWLQAEGFWAVLIMRLMPFVPSDVINFGSGFAGVRYRDFVFATLLGIFPGCIVFSHYGQLLQARPMEFLVSLPLFAMPLAIGVALAHWRLKAAPRA